MEWSQVGEWLKGNAGTGAALVGSLLTGNVPAAIAAGVALVSSATGHATPDEALQQFQTDPATLVKLKELAFQNDSSIREHVRAMTELELLDGQKEQEQTQLTIRAGDAAGDRFVRWTRPGQSWASLGAAFAYVGYCSVINKPVDVYVLGALLTLPWAYAGLRTVQHWGETVSAVKAAK